MMEHFGFRNLSKSVNWYTSGERKTACTAVPICFFSAPSAAVHVLNSVWFCKNLSVTSACSWAVPIIGS